VCVRVVVVVITMRAFIVVAAVAAVALASISLELDTHANLTNADADFSFRYCSTDSMTFTLLPDILTWSSLSVDLNGANESAKAAGNAMFGIGVMPSKLNVPFGLLFYGQGEANLKFDIRSFAQGLVSESPASAKFNGTGLAMIALGMQECNENNLPVGEYVALNTPSGLLSSACKGKKFTYKDEYLYGFSCEYSPSGTDADVTLTYVTSKNAGVLEYGKTPVSPRTLEMIIAVDGFKLKDKKNHVRLDLALVTASGAGKIEGNANVIHREDMEDLYVAASESVIIDKKPGSVSIDIDTEAAAGIADFVKKILNVALDATFDAKLTHVHMPAGAKEFVYDPAAGSGTVVYKAYNSASASALSLLVALICVLVYLF